MIKETSNVEISSSTTTEYRKILYVGTNCKIFCQQMVDLNYIGLSLNNSFKAYCWLKKMVEANNLPDAIICDLKLEGGDAFSLFESMKDDDKLKQIPFIVISKSFNKEERLQALKAGFDDFYPYPPNAMNIHKRLTFLLNNPKQFSVEQRAKNESKLRIPLDKRVFDILVSSILIIMLLPLFAVVALLIRMQSKGPIFYISKRAGQGYKVFDFYKFRSMRVGADKELKDLAQLNIYSAENLKNNAFSGEKTEKKAGSTFIKLENDPRVTRIGKFIRKTSIDELPQLFNVLKGDMSIVGNRPLPLYEAEQLTTDMWAKRFMAPSGITGLWQVAKGGKANVSDQERKMLDIVYASKFNLWLDIQILFKTFPALMQKG